MFPLPTTMKLLAPAVLLSPIHRSLFIPIINLAKNSPSISQLANLQLFLSPCLLLLLFDWQWFLPRIIITLKQASTSGHWPKLLIYKHLFLSKEENLQPAELIRNYSNCCYQKNCCNYPSALQCRQTIWLKPVV